VPRAPNEAWPLNFVSDSLEHGSRVKRLTITDDYTKEAINIPVHDGISGEYVTRVLGRRAYRNRVTQRPVQAESELLAYFRQQRRYQLIFALKTLGNIIT